jgi:hypothetical protein
VRLQAFAGAALYLQMPVNILQMPAISCQITAFLCRAYICLLRQGYGGSFSVASNVFVRTKPDFYVQKQKQCTLMNGES